MEHVIPYCHRLLKTHAKENSTCVDFTCGNGNDTLFLSTLCSKGTVLGFDIQKQAVQNTGELLTAHKIQNATVYCDSHENLSNYLKSSFDLGVFNLGYLPKGDPSVTTTAKTTLQAVEIALAHLASKGLLVIVCYINHPGGGEEASELEKYLQALNDNLFTVTKYSFLNKPTAPYVLAVKKRESE